MLNKNTITFDDSTKEFILDAFDKAVNQDDVIVEKDNPSQKVLSIDGLEVTSSQFAGIRKGSEIYIKSDLASLIQLCDALHKGQ